MIDIHGLTNEELKQELIKRKEKPYRALQLLQWIYQKGVTDCQQITDMSKQLREVLSKELATQTLKLVSTLDSKDQETTKFLWQLQDNQLVESVLIRAPDRRTVCVSSQVGCPARCAFCASGKQGLLRNLSASEIVQQVYLIDQWLKSKGERVSHIVYMGMGEPFENYDAVVKSILLLNDPERLHISQRRITVSTVGVVEGIQRFTQEDLNVNLVLSLHAPNQNIRKKIIPYARKYALEEILESMLYFAKTTHRDITYEYTLIAGINDAPEHAEELAKLIKKHPCTVNLIPYNPIDGIHLRRPEKEVIETFREILVDEGIATTWRYTKGKDIAAACGQLALKKMDSAAGPISLLKLGSTQSQAAASH